MRIRIRRLLADPRFQQAADALLGLLVLAASLAEIAARSAEWSGPVGVEILLAVACSVPLAWRRSHPIAVASVVAVSAMITAAVVAPVQGPFETFLAIEIAFYSVGVHARLRPGLLALVAFDVAWALLLVAVVLGSSGANSGDWFPTLVWTIGAWGIGRVIRSRNQRAIDLERLTVELAGERDARAREAVTVERARIARELHDVVAHNISVMGVQAAAAGRIMQGDEPEVRSALLAIETTGRDTVDEMRRMLGILRQADDELTLAPQPSLRDLGALIEKVKAAGLDVDVRLQGRPRPLPAGLDLSAYRIVQEALTNALKYAGSGHVEVVVGYTDDAVVLEIVDNGPGAAAGRGTGNGLVGMRERVALFGGDFRAGRRDDGGWELRATLPVGGT